MTTADILRDNDGSTNNCEQSIYVIHCNITILGCYTVTQTNLHDVGTDYAAFLVLVVGTARGGLVTFMQTSDYGAEHSATLSS